MLRALPGADCSLEPVRHIALTVPTLAVRTAISCHPSKLLLASLTTSLGKTTCRNQIGQCQAMLCHLFAYPEHCFSLRAQTFGRTCFHEGVI